MRFEDVNRCNPMKLMLQLVNNSDKLNIIFMIVITIKFCRRVRYDSYYSPTVETEARGTWSSYFLK